MGKTMSVAGILFAALLLSGCSGSAASALSSRTGIEYREEQINNLTGINAVVYHSDECTLWVFGDYASAASVSASDFPSNPFTARGQDIKTGDHVLMLADSVNSSCVEPTLNSIFGKTLSASDDADATYKTGDYSADTEASGGFEIVDTEVSSDDPTEEPATADCGSDDVELEVRRAGKSSIIEVVVVNISKINCYIEIGPGKTHLTISDGTSWVWSSSECLNQNSDSSEMLLAAGESLASASYEWDRSQSTGDGCSISDTGNEALPSGLYYFKAEFSPLRMASVNKQFRF